MSAPEARLPGSVPKSMRMGVCGTAMPPSKSNYRFFGTRSHAIDWMRQPCARAPEGERVVADHRELAGAAVPVRDHRARFAPRIVRRVAGLDEHVGHLMPAQQVEPLLRHVDRHLVQVFAPADGLGREARAAELARRRIQPRPARVLGEQVGPAARVAAVEQMHVAGEHRADREFVRDRKLDEVAHAALASARGVCERGCVSR